MALSLNNLTQDQQFAAAAEFAGVPEAILRGQWDVESGRGTNMRSEAGAEGHFQLMPQTRSVWERRLGRQFDPDNFEDALILASHTMRENMALARGDLDTALAIYHGGTNRANWGERTNSYAGKVRAAGGMVPGADAMATAWEGQPPEITETHRGVSFQDAWEGTPFDRDSTRARRQAREYLAGFERGVIDNAGLQAVTAAEIAGHTNTLGVGAEFSRAARDNLVGATRAYIEEMKGQGGPEASAPITEGIVQQAADRSIQAQEYADSLGLSDYWGAAFSSSLAAQALRLYENMENDKGYEPGWRYIDHIDEIETEDMTYRERMTMRQATTPSQVAFYKREIDQQRLDQRALGTLGTSGQIVAGLAGGISDPLGWAAGFGVMKAASMAGVGARTYIAAGRPLAAVGSSALEGGVGNLLAGATLEAMGAYRTTGDYIEDFGFGLMFGAALSIPGAVEARRVAQDMIAEGAARKVDLGVRAQQRAGANATPEQLRTAMREIEGEDDAKWLNAVFGDVPDMDRLMARPDVGPRVEAGEAGDGAAQTTSVFARARDRRALEEQYSLQERIPDTTMRNQVAELIGRAQRVNGRNGIDEERLRTILQRADLEATSTTMLSSESPVARAIGIMLMENPEGAAGRRATAALSRSQFFDQYVGTTNRDANAAFELWAKEQGAGPIKAGMSGDLQSRFYRNVAAEMDRRWNQAAPDVNVHPMVRLAADIYDSGYHRMGRDQQYVGVVGAERIDLTTSGYFQRSWNLGLLAERARTASGHKALVDMLEDQFRSVAGFGGDDFPRQLAEEYLDRLLLRAAGGEQVPANLYSNDTADILRDSLTALRLNEEEIQRVVSRYSRGGAGHTKGRIDMDLRKQYDDGAGNTFTALDLLDHNLPELYRRYAGRVAGDVALAKHGILGDAGIAVLREGMRHTGATPRELQAFDQFMSEMVGRRFGNADNKYLANARVLTGASRLGGAVFPQIGAYLDGMLAVGVGRVLRTIGDFPRLMGEIRAMSRGQEVDNPILGGLETLGPEFGTYDYRIMGMFDVQDQVEIYGRESVGMLSRAIRAIGNGARIMSGHRALTAVQTRGMAEQIVQKAWRYIRDGSDDAALNDMGFNPQMRAALRNTLDTVTEWDAYGNLKVFDPQRVTTAQDAQLMIAFRDAVWRGASQIVQRDFAGEVGKWAHNGLLKILFQFRTFPLIAHQKQLGRNLGVHGAARTMGLALGAMSIAMPIHMARGLIRVSTLPENEREEYLENFVFSPMVLARASMNYIGTLGLLPDVLDIGTGLGEGWASTAGVDLPQWMKSTGGRQMSHTDIIGGQFAPAVGLFNDIGQGIMGRPEKLIKSMPGSTLPYVQPLILAAESELRD